jgi:hypothetical protein
MPTDTPKDKLKAFVHITEDLIFDLDGIYDSIGESADQVRDALVKAIRMMWRNEWDKSLVKPYGILGTTFAFNFCSEYIFTFTIDTHFNQEKPVEDHYFLKNLYRKK